MTSLVTSQSLARTGVWAACFGVVAALTLFVPFTMPVLLTAVLGIAVVAESLMHIDQGLAIVLSYGMVFAVMTMSFRAIIRMRTGI
jgi:hypothetical protein